MNGKDDANERVDAGMVEMAWWQDNANDQGHPCHPVRQYGVTHNVYYVKLHQIFEVFITSQGGRASHPADGWVVTAGATINKMLRVGSLYEFEYNRGRRTKN
jgi:hypothetical protein